MVVLCQRRRIEQKRGRWSSTAKMMIPLLLLLLQGVTSFQPAPAVLARRANTLVVSPTIHTTTTVVRKEEALSRSTATSTTSLNFMGGDGGLLGVGSPEVVTIILVGYFVLGPSDLYKLVKEIGTFISNIRNLGTDLSTTFENNMESTLQLEELRKAQRELNDAFSFRRSINVDGDSDAFSVKAGSAQEAEAAAAAAAAAAASAVVDDPTSDASGVAPKKKKIRRRVVRQKPAPAVTEDPAFVATAMDNNIPDLEMPVVAAESADSLKQGGMSAAEVAEIDAEFNQYTTEPTPSSSLSEMDTGIDKGMDWFGRDEKAATAMEEATGSRFQQQMSGNWNDQILAAGDKLEPMSLVMNKIALLEQEKIAAVTRLEEEFQKRTELEQNYYDAQRKLLEEAVSEVQNAAFGVDEKSKTII